MNKKSSVLYINAMGPREKTPQGGTFITQRIRALRDIDEIEVIPVYPYIEYSVFTKFLLALRGIPGGDRVLTQQMDVTYDAFEMKYSLLEVFLSRYTSRAYYRKSQKALENMLKQYPEARLIHMHWIWPVGIALPDVAAANDIPYVVTCHGSDINVAMRRELNRKHMLGILENAYCVEFVSNALLNTAKELGYSGENAVVVNNGIDTELFCGKRISHAIYTVGFVGNLIPVKGADRLPHIFDKIYRMMKGNVRFVIAGDGDLRKALENEMKELPVVFHGRVSQEQLADIYGKMDVLIIPSRHEGYGCVIKEAQACGVFPVGNDVGGISEAIGEFGVIIPESGSEEKLASRMAEAVVKYLSGDYNIDLNTMIKGALDCSWQKKQEESMAVYFAASDKKK